MPTHPRNEDPADVRLGAFVRLVQKPVSEVLPELDESHFVVLGYPDDRGVDRNGGRLGASDGPDEIRKFLYNMTPAQERPLTIWDLGNLKSWSLSLEEAHEQARQTVNQLRDTGARVITLGGGHDWAYPDYADFLGRLLNIDAHLDMRPVTEDVAQSSHSGTPFRKIYGPRRDATAFGVLGLQAHCNARHHIEYARGLRASLLFLEEMPWSLDEQWPLVRDRFALTDEKLSFALSVDLDAFPQALAPGVSAPQTLGVDPRIALKMIETLGARLKHLGIYELNPRFDQDGATARLAAKLIFQYLHQA